MFTGCGALFDVRPVRSLQFSFPSLARNSARAPDSVETHSVTLGLSPHLVFAPCPPPPLHVIEPPRPWAPLKNVRPPCRLHPLSGAFLSNRASFFSCSCFRPDRPSPPRSLVKLGVTFFFLPGQHSSVVFFFFLPLDLFEPLSPSPILRDSPAVNSLSSERLSFFLPHPVLGKYSPPLLFFSHWNGTLIETASNLDRGWP